MSEEIDKVINPDPKEDQDLRRRKLIVWIAAGGFTGLAMMTWIFFLPAQLRSVSGDSSGRWSFLQPDPEVTDQSFGSVWRDFQTNMKALRERDKSTGLDVAEQATTSEPILDVAAFSETLQNAELSVNRDEEE